MSDQMIANEPDDATLQEVAEALNATFQRISNGAPRPVGTSFEVSSGRFIIFSDLHRGNRNGADDFMCCEEAYNAALAYYFEEGHTLILLGDIEDLWEERPEDVREAYPDTYRLEKKFHEASKYLRVWGNHDDDWKDPDRIKRVLQCKYGTRTLNVPEGIILRVVEKSGESLGSIMLIHGHQGDWKSDTWAWLSKPIVRWLWCPFQRRTKFSFNTPAKDWKLRDQYNIAMARWAEQKSGFLLISGHTHQPVFESRPREAKMEYVYNFQLQAAQFCDEANASSDEALREAKEDWDKVKKAKGEKEQLAASLKKPCYFNTGCSSYYDGHITGIEIVNGDIRLVRWPNNSDTPRPQILESRSLREVLQECK